MIRDSQVETSLLSNLELWLKQDKSAVHLTSSDIVSNDV